MESTNEWTLESLNIYQDYNKKGFYCGNVKFRNGQQMDMSLRLGNEQAVKMITLIQEEIKTSANNLSELLAKSMPLQIEAKNES